MQSTRVRCIYTCMEACRYIYSAQAHATQEKKEAKAPHIIIIIMDACMKADHLVRSNGLEQSLARFHYIHTVLLLVNEFE